jgi:integrase
MHVALIRLRRVRLNIQLQGASMSVRKRTWTTRKGDEKEKWVVDYTDQNGNRHLETFTRKKDADIREAAIRVEVGKGTHVAPSDSITVAEAATNWLNRVKADGLERSTLASYQIHVDKHILPTNNIGKVKLAKLTPSAVEQFRDQLLKEPNPLSRALARKVLVSFKSLLKQAKCSHLIADIKIGGGKREQRLEAGRDFPEMAEVRRLVAKANTPRPKALLLTAILTGLRASELRGLRWTDVDAAELHVRQRADRYRKIGTPKSRAGTRTIPMPPELVSALKAWKLACPLDPKERRHELVFPSKKGETDHNSNLMRYLTPVMLAAGVVHRTIEVNGEETIETLTPKYGMHSFRHFFASWCINPKSRGGRELPAKVVQQYLGHSSIVITLDVYGHLFPDNSDHAELATATAALMDS